MSYQNSTNLVFLYMCYLWGAFIGAIALLTAGHLWEVRTCIALRNAYGY
jgi:hypothetical protein